jgi:hypothetical protein
MISAHKSPYQGLITLTGVWKSCRRTVSRYVLGKAENTNPQQGLIQFVLVEEVGKNGRMRIWRRKQAVDSISDRGSGGTIEGDNGCGCAVHVRGHTRSHACVFPREWQGFCDP